MTQAILVRMSFDQVRVQINRIATEAEAREKAASAVGDGFSVGKSTARYIVSSRNSREEDIQAVWYFQLTVRDSSAPTS